MPRSPMIFAQADKKAGTKQPDKGSVKEGGEKDKSGGGGFGWQLFLPMILIFVVFYFLIIMPQRRRDKKAREQLTLLKKNDKVMTASGIIGVVSYISDKEDEITLRIEEGKIRVLKSAVAQIITKDDATDAEKKD